MSCWLNSHTGSRSLKWPVSKRFIGRGTTYGAGRVKSNLFLIASLQAANLLGTSEVKTVSLTAVLSSCFMLCGFVYTFITQRQFCSLQPPYGSIFFCLKKILHIPLLKVVSSYCHWVSFSSPILRLSLFNFSAA